MPSVSMLPAVGPGVLIPRPETELMVDFVEEAVAAAPQLATGAWADLGTGSGALACGVARALQQAERVRVVVGVCGHQASSMGCLNKKRLVCCLAHALRDDPPSPHPLSTPSPSPPTTPPSISRCMRLT